jgi:hypothetical protein
MTILIRKKTSWAKAGTENQIMKRYPIIIEYGGNNLSAYSKKSNAVFAKPSSYTLRGCGKTVHRFPNLTRQSPMSNCKVWVDRPLKNGG